MKGNMKTGIINNTLVVNFDGDIDNEVSPRYKSELTNLIESYKFKKIIFDFKNVTFIDSSGLGLILGRYNEIKKYNGKVYAKDVGNPINRIFDVAGMWTIINKYEEQKTFLEKEGVCL